MNSERWSARSPAPKLASVSRGPARVVEGSSPFLPILLVALGAWVACADFSRGHSSATGGGLPGPMNDGSDAGSGASYAAGVHALLLDGCASCHSATGAASGTALVLTGSAPDDYLATLDFVDVGAPGASRLVVKMEGRGHAGGAIYTGASPEHAQVLRWIGEGAAP